MNIKYRLCAMAVLLALIGGIFSTMLPTFADSASDNQTLQTRSVDERSGAVRTETPRVSLYINNAVIEEKGYLINDTTYVPLRAFAENVGRCEVSWKKGVATVQTDTLNLNVEQNSNYVTANERILYHSQPIRNINDRIYVPVRSMAKAYSLDVEWEGKTRTVYLSGDPKGLKKADEYYDSTDLYWLSRIIHAESQGEPLLGKVAVGNVVINRKNREDYPDTIYGVIFDKKYGTQFSPVAYGTIYNTPSAESVKAAKICLEGFSVNTEMIFFINPKIATNFWISNTRTFVVKIGNHYFYK